MNTTAGKQPNIVFTCAYIPVEIISAAGFTPIRMIPETRQAEADPFIHPLTCGYIKSLLAAGLRNDLSEMAGIIIPNCCDGMRKLNDIWKKYVNIPSLMLDVPKKTDSLSIEFFASELRRFADRLHNQMASPAAVTPETLAPSIIFWNRTRSQMGDVFSAMEKTGINGPLYQQYMEMMKMEPDEMIDASKRLAEHIANQPVNHRKISVMISGSLFPDAKLIEHIDRAGGRVAVLDTCIGNRHFKEQVQMGMEDPYWALAKRYLEKPLCPRMIALSSRSDQFMEQIRSAGVRGVVMSTMRYCDTAMYEQMPLAQCVREAGVPFLALENSYAGALSEQEKTRIDAFFESMGKTDL